MNIQEYFSKKYSAYDNKIRKLKEENKELKSRLKKCKCHELQEHKCGGNCKCKGVVNNG